MTPLEEAKRRQGLWVQLTRRSNGKGLPPALLRELGIYGGGQGIWVNKALTINIDGAEDGVAVAVLHNGSSYDDDLTQEYLIYHYPSTARRGIRDLSETKALVACSRLSIPIFVITHNEENEGLRDLYLVTKSLILAALVLGTSALFVPLDILHPGWMLAFLLLTSVTFCLFGFILGVWAKSWEQLWIVPGLIVTPLAFLGGAFYSIDMLPPAWQTVALFNPVVYLISGFRWSFFGTADVAIVTSLGAVFSILIMCFAVVAWIFKTGYRLKN